MTTSNTKTKPAMSAKKSSLWQRLRAARAFAEKTQGDVAKELDLSRPAISLWESKEPGLRTNPTGEQLMQLARFLKVPVAFFVDDTVDAEAVWNYQVASPSSFTSIDTGVCNDSRTSRAFWAAVEYNAVLRHSHLATAFNVPVRNTSIALSASFLHGRNLVGFSCEAPGDLKDALMSGVSTLLVVERAFARKDMHKELLIWTRTGRFEISGRDVFEQTFGVKVFAFNDIEKATEHLLAL